MPRKRIGSKVQAAAPDAVVEYIKNQARLRSVDEAVVTRELVIAGHAVLAGAEKA